MEYLEVDLIRAEETKPISTKARLEPNNQFKILENPDVFNKLGKQELEITKKLQKLKQNRVKLDKKRKSISWYNTRQSIDRKMLEISELHQYLNQLDHICSPEEILLNEQLVKLHKGRHHGSINLVKERRLLKQIKQPIGEKEKISSANGPTEAATSSRLIQRWGRWHNSTYLCTSQEGYIIDSSSEQSITSGIEALSEKVEELRMKKMEYEAYNDRLDLEEAAIEKEIKIAERKLENIKQKKVQLTLPVAKTGNEITEWENHLCIKGSSISSRTLLESKSIPIYCSQQLQSC